jgi:hypothetical protein
LNKCLTKPSPAARPSQDLCGCPCFFVFGENSGLPRFVMAHPPARIRLIAAIQGLLDNKNKGNLSKFGDYILLQNRII